MPFILIREGFEVAPFCTLSSGCGLTFVNVVYLFMLCAYTIKYMLLCLGMNCPLHQPKVYLQSEHISLIRYNRTEFAEYFYGHSDWARVLCLCLCFLLFTLFVFFGGGGGSG